MQPTSKGVQDWVTCYCHSVKPIEPILGHDRTGRKSRLEDPLPVLLMPPMMTFGLLKMVI